jgi:hypothetical protein
VLTISRVVVAAACVLVPLSTSGQAPKQYLCVADASAGFSYQKGEWRPVIFNPDDQRWVVRTGGVRKAPFSVKKLGSEDEMFTCPNGFNEDGDMLCRPTIEIVSDLPILQTGGTFNISRTSGRFLLTTTHGFWRNVNSQADAKGDSPYITIGKCSGF